MTERGVRNDRMGLVRSFANAARAFTRIAR